MQDLNKKSRVPLSGPSYTILFLINLLKQHLFPLLFFFGMEFSSKSTLVFQTSGFRSRVLARVLKLHHNFRTTARCTSHAFSLFMHRPHRALTNSCGKREIKNIPLYNNFLAMKDHFKSSSAKKCSIPTTRLLPEKGGGVLTVCS